MTEEEFQCQVAQVAQLLGWEYLHVRPSIGKGKRWMTATNVVGWPDMLLWKPARELVALELKVPPNKATEAQLVVLAQLQATGHVHAQVLYPDGLDALVKHLQHYAPGTTPP